MSRLSLAEELLAEQLRPAGVRFSRQYRYVPGRRFRADFAIPKLRLLIEVTGGVYTRQAHGSVEGVLRDIERLNEATLAGWRMLRVTPDMVEDGRALALVQRALDSASPPRRRQG